MKKDDRGLSLVELLIAVAILAIVMVPFFHSFITSAKLNQKAKRMMRATTVAENIMEGIRPKSMEEIVLQLCSDGVPGHEPVCTLVSSYDTHQELLIAENAPLADGSKTTAASYVEADGEWKFNGQASHVYYFALTGIRQDNQKYDAQIKLDASGYYKTGEETENKYNDEELVQIDGLDLTKDVLYVLSLADEKKVYDVFAERSIRHIQNGSAIKTAEDFEGSLTRTITISIQAVGTGQEVTLDITYQAPEGWVADSERKYSRTMQLYFTTDATKTLRNIYIMYPPNYNSVAGAVKDIFLIKNTNKIDCDVYLIKQVTDTAARLEAREMNYKAEVEVIETTGVWDKDNDAVLKLHHNFTENLGKKEMGIEDYFMPDRTDYKYNSYLGQQALDKLSVQGLMDRESSNRMFHTEIRIYEDGAFDATTEMFDEDKFIMSFEN